ncbi:hypothetical protein O6H91_04G083700 [Diphasiastrum complanatum]|uniref:Uncharacterized protein n=2 Tax=Diphasiastrum complanatum TaxID=34168 RepID=A0ACC2DYT2_DIPCM|nr:hypothetical protein O6H91_04G083700 [Diphasiastrum complanatum]KAJ7559407.1 hypothetical protein O6H91_04G083700 [Diphasiastrum complanatum]
MALCSPLLVPCSFSLSSARVQPRRHHLSLNHSFALHQCHPLLHISSLSRSLSLEARTPQTWKRSSTNMEAAEEARESLNKPSCLFISSSRDSLIWHFHDSGIRQQHQMCSCSINNITQSEKQGARKKEDIGVVAAIALLKFYKSEISPYIPGSCRYVPTCSEYSMQAYKAYGFFRGTVLTFWRILRCNPWGGSGFDPPRWFDD